MSAYSLPLITGPTPDTLGLGFFILLPTLTPLVPEYPDALLGAAFEYPSTP